MTAATEAVPTPDHTPNSPFVRERIHAIVGSLSEAEYLGGVRAVAVLWVDPEGNIHSSFFGQPNSTFPLLAGLQLINHEILQGLAPEPPPPDQFDPSAPLPRPQPPESIA